MKTSQNMIPPKFALENHLFTAHGWKIMHMNRDTPKYLHPTFMKTYKSHFHGACFKQPISKWYSSEPFENRTLCVIRATISCNRLEGWTGVSGESPVNYYMSFSEIMLVFLCLHPDGLLEAVTAGVLYKVAHWLGGEHSTTNNDHNAHSYLIIYRHFKLFTERAL